MLSTTQPVVEVLTAEDIKRINPNEGLHQYFKPYPKFSLDVLAHDTLSVEEEIRNEAGNDRSQIEIPAFKDQNSRYVASRVTGGSTVRDSIIKNSLVTGYSKVTDHALVQGSSEVSGGGKVGTSAVQNGSKVGGYAEVWNQSIVDASILQGGAKVDASNLVAVKLLGYAQAQRSVMEDSQANGGAKVFDSMVRATSHLDGYAEVLNHSLVDSSTIKSGGKASDSAILGKAVLSQYGKAGRRSVVHSSSVTGGSAVEGGQLWAQASLSAYSKVFDSLVFGVNLDEGSEVHAGSVVLGNESHKLRESIVTGKSLLHNTSGNRIIACCGAKITDSSLQDGFVFGSALENYSNNEQRIIKIGESCPMSSKHPKVDWTQVSDDRIVMAWAECHPTYASIVYGRLPAPSMYSSSYGMFGTPTQEQVRQSHLSQPLPLLPETPPAPKAAGTSPSTDLDADVDDLGDLVDDLGLRDPPLVTDGSDSDWDKMDETE